MLETPVSLIERLRHRGESADWQLFLTIYTPLIRRWLGRNPMLRADADDLTQEVLSTVVHGLPEFMRRRAGSFRRWLRSITVSRLTDHLRSRRKHQRTADAAVEESVLRQLADPASELSRQWDREHDQHVFQCLLAMIEPEFSAKTWKAFRLYCIDEMEPARVATQLGVSKNVVLLAKSRVLKRLRELGRGLID